MHWKLASVVSSESKTAIEGGTFRGCRNLTSVKVPESMKMIKTGAFQTCPELKNVAIPKGTEVEAKAF